MPRKQSMKYIRPADETEALYMQLNNTKVKRIQDDAITYVCCVDIIINILYMVGTSANTINFIFFIHFCNRPVLVGTCRYKDTCMPSTVNVKFVNHPRNGEFFQLGGYSTYYFPLITLTQSSLEVYQYIHNKVNTTHVDEI